jgi:hypothetical protein
MGAREILIIVLVVVMFSAMPVYPYSSGWTWYPSAGFLFLIVVLILLLFHA